MHASGDASSDSPASFLARFGWRGLVIAAVTTLLAGCGGAAAPAESKGGGKGAGSGAGGREVRTVMSVEDQLVRRVGVTGTLAAEEQVTLSLKVTGRLESLLVDLGSHVRRGQVVARLMPNDFELRVSQAAAALQQARARLGLQLDAEDEVVDPARTAVVRQAAAVLEESRLTRERAETFFKRGIGSKASLDAAVAALEVAEGRYQDALEEVRNRQAVLEQRRSELELAQQALDDSSLTAPFDGMVRERLATVGQYLAAGSPVVTIVRMHPLRLRLALPEREAALIRTGLQVQVTVEGDPKVYAGRVARVSPAIDEASRTLMIEAEVPNPNGELRPGSYANASVITASRDKAVLIPTAALVTFAGVNKVLVVEQGRAVEKPVEVGRREGERVEILDGLEAGVDVIIEPGNLVQGDAVRVAGGSAGVGDGKPAPSAR
jgi:multidrug efflux pump subunit AcrA (membrane-fusion protein)